MKLKLVMIGRVKKVKNVMQNTQNHEIVVYDYFQSIQER